MSLSVAQIDPRRRYKAAELLWYLLQPVWILLISSEGTPPEKGGGRGTHLLLWKYISVIPSSGEALVRPDGLHPTNIWLALRSIAVRLFLWWLWWWWLWLLWLLWLLSSSDRRFVAGFFQSHRFSG